MTLSESNDAALRFMWAIQALAAPAREQLQLFPEFAETADELALDHEEAQATYLEGAGSTLSAEQRGAIDRLDQQLEGMSGPGNAQNWTANALSAAPGWERVRELAAAVLREMGWPLQLPPGDRGAIYLGPPEE